MPQKDYYKTLGLSKSASQDEIKSAYRKLAKQYHPDLHPGDNAAAEKFKEVNEAYSVLGDADKRKRYDNGEMDMGGGQGYNPFGSGGFTASGFDDIFDMFSDAFGFGGGSARRTTRSSGGSDITYTVELTFMESILGCKKPINFTRAEKCPDCGGSGAKSDAHSKACDKCGGSGQVRISRTTLFGQQITVGPCDKCGGTGKIVTDFCKSCGGKGVVNKNKVINVSIPAGVENGAVLQLAGEGNATKGKTSRNGNLLLVISVKPSKVFRRENFDLHVNVPVSFVSAVCGGEVEIPAPDGMFIYRMPEGTSNGDTVRFRGKGVKTARGAGDLYATFSVEVPRNISMSQKQKLRDFEKDCSVKNYAKKKEFLDEVAKLYKK